ncbi:AsmA family protein [Flavihumibacter sp. R14]|nr:AsmA family protein [Flavihumibacter soli]
MPRWTRITLIIAGALLAIIIIAWLALAAYVYTHKKELLGSIIGQLNENLNGTLTVETMDPALISGFPGVSVTLNNIILRDSLWQNHRHDVLNAVSASISVDAFSILRGKPTINNITVNKGKVHFFTDSLGNSNLAVFRKKPKKETSSEKKRKQINRFELHNVRLVFENQKKAKFFDFDISTIDAKIKYNNKGWEGKVKINMLVNSLTFKTRRGSFLKNKKLETNLDLVFDRGLKLLRFPMQDFKIGEDKFEIGGQFSLAKNSSAFGLDVKTKKIALGNAAALLTPNIGSKISRYNLSKPISAGATIRGGLKAGSDTRIIANWEVENNTLSLYDEKVTNCSFTGSYNNTGLGGQLSSDENSAIRIYKMKGDWNEIPFTADSIIVANLKVPVLTGKFLADFPLMKLNPIFAQTFAFTNGTAHLDVLYKAPLDKNDSVRYINGKIQVKDASLKYLSRNLAFNNGNATLDFRGQDLFLRGINVQSGGSSLQMEGSIRNFLKLIYTHPEKMFLDWNISSRQINLGQFMAFLKPRQARPRTAGNSKFSARFDHMLSRTNVRMKVRVDRLIYKKFVAQDVNSNLTLTEKRILIQNVSLKHAGGSFIINGNLDQGGRSNQFKVNTRIRNTNVQQLFYGFDNFGQNGITDKNLRGTLNADCNLSGSISESGKMASKSTRGTVGFSLTNGALINFEPVEKIGNIAFSNRDFSNITFKKLSNTFTIRGDKIIIPPMLIQSSVLEIHVEGVYGFTSGTNMYIQVPLRNPEKEEKATAKNRKKNKKEKKEKKGIVLNLQAVDEGGQVKIKMAKKKD